jgi:hypothetical protein
MDEFRFDAESVKNALQQFRASGWSQKRAAAIHFLIDGWDIRQLAAWMGRRGEDLRSDWQQFLELAKPPASQSDQLELLPGVFRQPPVKDTKEAIVHDHY